MVPILTWLTDMEYMCRKWPPICSIWRSENPVFLSSFMIYYRISNNSNTTNATVMYNLSYIGFR